VPPEDGLAISELFFSLQGESTYVGLPCLFIRLTGCNLRCRYCDASYTYTEEGETYTIASLLAFVDRHPGAMVEVTGGEPLVQKNCIPLLQALTNQGRTVLLETNGSLDLAAVPKGVITIMDVKCPGSGMEHALRRENFALLKDEDEIKFVLTSRLDYEWALAIIREHRLIDSVTGRARHPLLFSPVTEALPPAELAAWLISDNLPIRLQLQLHKLLWPATTRGV
jgi:7-carboxy-7-deazaguanine synthase